MSIINPTKKKINKKDLTKILAEGDKTVIIHRKMSPLLFC